MIEPSLADIASAARRSSAALRPIFRIKEGSEGREPVGTAILLGSGNIRVFVTAEHVLTGPEKKLMALSAAGSVAWPRKYRVVRSLLGSLPHPDLAFYTATTRTYEPFEGDTPLPLNAVKPGLSVSTPMSFVAAGFPTSKSRFLGGQTRLRNGLAFLGVQAVDETEYAELGLNPKLHIVTSYDRESMQDEHGNSITTVDPRGMSGGALFVAAAREAGDGGAELACLLAGVLIEYHRAPRNLLVAVRIDALLEAVTDFRSPGGPFFSYSERSGT